MTSITALELADKLVSLALENGNIRVLIGDGEPVGDITFVPADDGTEAYIEVGRG